MYVKCHNETNDYVQLTHANRNYEKNHFRRFTVSFVFLQLFPYYLSAKLNLIAFIKIASQILIIKINYPSLHPLINLYYTFTTIIGGILMSLFSLFSCALRHLQ